MDVRRGLFASALVPPQVGSSLLQLLDRLEGLGRIKQVVLNQDPHVVVHRGALWVQSQGLFVFGHGKVELALATIRHPKANQSVRLYLLGRIQAERLGESLLRIFIVAKAQSDGAYVHQRLSVIRVEIHSPAELSQRWGDLAHSEQDQAKDVVDRRMFAIHLDSLSADQPGQLKLRIVLGMIVEHQSQGPIGLNIV